MMPRDRGDIMENSSHVIPRDGSLVSSGHCMTEEEGHNKEDQKRAVYPQLAVGCQKRSTFCQLKGP